MNTREVLAIAWRYTFAFGKGYLSTFLSSLSMIGLVLAIALLITVLSVMNGFDKEMRERILALVPHVTVYSHLAAGDWQAVEQQVSAHPSVVQVAPFAQFDAMLIRGKTIETARVIGLDFGAGKHSEALLRSVPQAQRDQFSRDRAGLILGRALARKLEVAAGDAITLLVPGEGRSARASRHKSVTLVAVLDTGTELDQTAAFVPLALASSLAGLDGGVSGLQVRVADIFSAGRIGWELVNELPAGHYSSNWMMTHGNLYAAIQLSRDLVSILLFSIIAVAAFNVVSSLVLVVFDKRGDIAILRTLGASPGNIAWIFVFQGAMIGLVGVVFGALLGVLGSLVVGDAVAWLEYLLGIRFLNTDVYPVSFLPSELLARDIVWVSGVAFVMCLLAAVYPAMRAARLAPASVLHQE